MDIRQKPRLFKLSVLQKKTEGGNHRKIRLDIKGWIGIKLFLIGTWVKNICLKMTLLT